MQEHPTKIIEILLYMILGIALLYGLYVVLKGPSQYTISSNKNKKEK